MGHAFMSSHIISMLMSLLGGLAVILVRLRAANKPTSLKKIIMPPIGMATGFAMFIVPMMRVPWLWGLAAFLTGAVLFSYPLIRTSRFHVMDGKVYLKRSSMFIIVIVVLLALRLLLHDVVEQYISIYQTGSLFFLLAFGMLLPWRLAMLRQYQNLMKTAESHR